MPTFTLVAWSNPTEGKEDEYGKWYDETHLQDMLGVPGIKTAQRFKLLRLGRSKMFDQRYLCLYEFEAEDEESAKKIINTINAQNLVLSDSLNISSVNLGVYQATGPVQVKKK